jgi:O-antigen ligase
MNSDIFFSKTFLINLLIIFIPFSFIAGNLILNLNILLLIFFGLFFHGFEIFRNNLSKIDKIIIILFIYIVANGVFNNFFNFNFSEYENKNIILIKSLLFSRFLIMYFVLKFLIRKNLINYKLLFFSFGFSALFVSIDIIIQYYFDKDMFGFEGVDRRLSGPFGDELIAGSFIQRFFIFIPFSLYFFLKPDRKFSKQIAFLFTLVICIFAAFLAGNRIPLVLLFFTLGLIFFYQHLFRVVLLLMLIISIGCFSYLTKKDGQLQAHYKGFMMKSFQVIDYLKIRITDGEVKFTPNVYTKEIETGILTWQQNKLFGGGIKSFYYNCTNIKNSTMDKTGGTNCNTHPHNYYLEVASILGIFGLLIITIMFSMIFVKSIKKIHFSENLNYNKNFLIPFFLIFIIEIFPFKTTGSFFTTSNSTFLFIIISFIVGLLEFKKKLIYE